ncbi:hypothetical protein SSPS47_35015 [Streptomyces sp. S4.7]|uniref:hypothetical protein n=1 Tax=Streptomyces sp. S4.7 TaxID=2705439 RepID=UPI001397B828|nr:hypothetical protein [Streptomyces sp. S4.7]QHY93533.1 hypothetical protein SSPS47_00105 [Streptomyces sp. S4.7]QHZ00315.1 hypothetical protein SSPS47_35015 [Streptomyces sp. S4.7]
MHETKSATLLTIVAVAVTLMGAPATAHAAPRSVETAVARTTASCQIGDGHTDFKGTNINMRNSPGGAVIGVANTGDCAYYYKSDPGPLVVCPDGSNTAAWSLVVNKRTKVLGYVSG